MPDTEALADRLYTVPELARLLRVSVETAWRLVWSREIKSLKIGRARRVSASDLAAFLAAARNS